MSKALAAGQLKMKGALLMLSAFLPSPNSPQAGQKTAFRNLVKLAEHHEVWLLTFRNEVDRMEDETVLRSLCRFVYVEPVSGRKRLAGILGRPSLPVLIGSRWSTRLAQVLRGVLAQHAFDRVHLEWSQMVAYAKLLESVPNRTLYVHDVLTQWAGRRADTRGLLWRLEAWRSRQWERKAYRPFDRLFAPSAKDVQLLASLNPVYEAKCSVLPLHFDRYGLKSGERSSSQGRILFWGALGRPENANAARWLLQEVLPRLSGTGKTVQLIVAGSNPPSDLLRARNDRVSVPGFVSDPGPLFESADLAVLPVFDGAGVKVKVMECLASGLPVLTTRIGAEGIDASQEDGLFVLPPEPAAFCSEITRLIGSYPLLCRLARAAAAWGRRQTVNSWDLLISPRSESASS